MLAQFETDNGIMTNDMSSPGYVWFDCERYGLEDNTRGRIGKVLAGGPCGGIADSVEKAFKVCMDAISEV